MCQAKERKAIVTGKFACLEYLSYKMNVVQQTHIYKAVKKKKKIKPVIQILFPIKMLYTPSNSTDCCIITFDLFQYN